MIESVLISIHAPREGSDFLFPVMRRPPAISIHAPREGSDREKWAAFYGTIRISIHAPREGSDSAFMRSNITDREFQSTLPARGATP